MDKCLVIELLEVEMIRLTPSSVKQVLESMSQEPFFLDLEPTVIDEVRNGREHIVNFFILSS